MWSQRIEWNDGPSKSSMPSMSGIFGRFSDPTALMTARAVYVSMSPPADAGSAASVSFTARTRTSHVPVLSS